MQAWAVEWAAEEAAEWAAEEAVEAEWDEAEDEHFERLLVNTRGIGMPDISKKIEGKKYMWDGNIYEEEDQAKEVKQTYEDNDFKTELISEEGRFLVYTRRVVTDVVIEVEAS